VNRTDRIVVTSRSFSRNKVLREELIAAFADVTFNDGGAKLEGRSLLAFLDGHDRAIIALERLDEAVIGCLPRLKIVSKYGVGLDNIDVAALRRHGKRLGWRGGVNRRSVAELALSFMISLMHRVPEAAALVRQGGWAQIMGRQLTGKAVGIIGCGHVGKELVEILRPFGTTILVHDIVPYEEFYRANAIEAVDLETLLKRSDIVTLHVPYDESTRGMLNAERIAVMKPGAVLLNTARGGLVDEAAVKTALLEARLAGIAFDVFAMEPPVDAELLALPNVLATPHIGGSAEEAILAMGRAAIRGLEENDIP
jgi:D-3-phosphoglycerate dehydrogenase